MPALQVVLTMIEVVLSGGVFALSSGAEAWASMIAPARWGMAALASTINLNVITPANPLAPVKPDALWTHTSAQWGKDIVVLVLIGLICLFIARRGGSPGSGRDGARPPPLTNSPGSQSRPGPFDRNLVFVLNGNKSGSGALE